MPAYSQSYMKVVMALCWEAAKEPASSQGAKGTAWENVCPCINSNQECKHFLSLYTIRSNRNGSCMHLWSKNHAMSLWYEPAFCEFLSHPSTRASWDNFLINFLQMVSSPRLSLRSPSWTINCQNVSFLDASNVCMIHRQPTWQSLKHSHTVRDCCVII